MTDNPREVLIGPDDAATDPVPVALVAGADLEGVLAGAGALAKGLASSVEFKAKSGQALVLPAPDGRPQRVLLGLGSGRPSRALRSLPSRLPPGDYRLEGPLDGFGAAAFAAGAYRFDRYRSEPPPRRARLVVEDAAALRLGRRIAEAQALVRDLVNTPANGLGPAELEAAVREVAQAAGASLSVVVGEDLLSANYPAVHAVGRAAGRGREPRMIEAVYAASGLAEGAPLVVVIGKGVTFDSGGLDIKPSSGMRWMKKDMGGAAHALGLARLLMDGGLRARIVVLIPAVENAISGDAMRPGDILSSRSGLSIEVGNTDAEGRLILADALTRAGELKPDLTITLATLTGAARVALGPEIPPFYTDEETLASDLALAALERDDPLWRLPLWDGYEASLESDVADLKNDPDGWAQAGSITAALFLRRFAPKSGAFLHLDLFAWNPRSRPGAPQGAEAQGLLALRQVIVDRYGQ